MRKTISKVITRRTALARLGRAAGGAALASLGVSQLRAARVLAQGATDPGELAASTTVAAGSSLQAAIDRTAPGGTVAVAPGTRVETVTIDKPLRLIGIAGLRETILAADRSAFRWSGLPRERYRVGAVNVVGTHDVTIRGFTFLDALEGVWISASRRVTVVDCMSCAHDSSGFYVWGSQDVTLARCQGQDNAVGMYQGGSVAVSILDSEFTRNVGGHVAHLDDQEYPGTGILLGNFSRGCVVEGNHVHGNHDWGLGVSLGVSEVTARRNRFADNRVGVFAGARGLAVHRNDIVGNRELGVDAAAQCDARRNWWGDPSGPSGAGPGSGDAVTPTVAVEPWLEEPVEPVEPNHGEASGA